MMDFGRRRNVRQQSMSRSSDGRLFHKVSPETEKSHASFVLILTLIVDLVVDDLDDLERP